MIQIIPFADSSLLKNTDDKLVNQMRYEGMWIASGVNDIKDIFDGYKLPPFFDYVIYPLQSQSYLVCKDIEEIKERVWDKATNIFDSDPMYPDMYQVVNAQHYSWQSNVITNLYHEVSNNLENTIEIDTLEV